MHWNFQGFNNWPAASGELSIREGFDVFRASDLECIPRDVCESCVCWREFGTCHMVQVEDWELDRKNKAGCGYEGIYFCTVHRNCCPILFFDFIGVKLTELQEIE